MIFRSPVYLPTARQATVRFDTSTGRYLVTYLLFYYIMNFLSKGWPFFPKNIFLHLSIFTNCVYQENEKYNELSRNGRVWCGRLIRLVSPTRIISDWFVRNDDFISRQLLRIDLFLTAVPLGFIYSGFHLSRIIALKLPTVTCDTVISSNGSII